MEARFDFQKWPVYQESQSFLVEAYRVCGELPKDSATGVRDQLIRASQSIPLNIAEGSARYTGRDKGCHYGAKIFRQEIMRLGIRHTRTMVNTPQGNAVIERFFRSLKQECV